MRDPLAAEREELTRVLRRPIASRADFVDGIRQAISRGSGYAAGKLGGTERTLLFYPVLRARETDETKLRAYELSLAFKALRHAGIFPADVDFYRRFAERYLADVRDLDCLGLFVEEAPAVEREILDFHGLEMSLLPFRDQEPDRSSPNDEARCYLKHFRDRKVLLVAPFAELLRDRATEETFEAVWAKTGKPWFHPAAVDALEFPYGFDPATWSRYGSALELLDHITAELVRRDFDVALIAAGGLGDSIAAAAKRDGRVGISLGGHLQVLFGVLGERWRGSRKWQRRYFNDAWIDMPQRYRPDPAHTGANYW